MRKTGNLHRTTSSLRSNHFIVPLIVWLITIKLNASGIDCNIMDMGANPDGKTISTGIIQKAIDRCHSGGGGRVIIPAGKFLTGTIELKSNVSIFLTQGAILLGSTEINDYRPMEAGYESLRTMTRTRQLIYANNQENIAITGYGTIDGQGGAETFKQKIPDPFGLSDVGTDRPHLILMISCRNVRIQGVSLSNSAAWMQHYLACDNLYINDIKVHNFSNKNNDGLDIDGCHNVRISDCLIESADDGIVLKTTCPRSCENIVINNCIIHSFSNAVKIGTETTGDFLNISLSNLAISPPENIEFKYNESEGISAIALMSVDGGVIDNINISNVTVSKVVCPIFINLGNRGRKYKPDAHDPPVGKVKNIRISNFTARSSHRISSSISGFPGHYAENITFDNVTIISSAKGTPDDNNRVVPEVGGYPHPRMYGRILPSSAFFIRYAKNLRFTNFQLIIEEEDYRPAFVLENSENIRILHPVVESLKTSVELVDNRNSQKIEVVK